jgi:hypothetical protein
MWNVHLTPTELTCWPNVPVSSFLPCSLLSRLHPNPNPRGGSSDCGAERSGRRTRVRAASRAGSVAAGFAPAQQAILGGTAVQGAVPGPGRLGADLLLPFLARSNSMTANRAVQSNLSWLLLWTCSSSYQDCDKRKRLRRTQQASSKKSIRIAL